MTDTWNDGVRGDQLRPLINHDAPLIRVEAGPGTGKTFGLIRRVERIVHPDGLAADGRKLLVVAFNRVIAEQLKTEISERLMPLFQQTRFPVVKTIHGLCVSMLSERLRLLLPHEREAMIYDVLCQFPDLRNLYTKFGDAEQALRNHEANHEDHITLWQACQRWLDRHRAHLIGDVPRLVLDRIQGGDYTDAKYNYVIVDEFQDLTPGEQKLMAHLVSRDGQLIVLGDPRQSIYKFRGNDADGLENLDRVAPFDGSDAIIDIRMNQCHRCPSEVVVAANRLMSLSPALEMSSTSEADANIHVVTWKHPNDEACGMAKCIVDNLANNGVDRHLVMVTRRQFGYWLRDRIIELAPELSVELNFSEGLLETWPAREAFLFFCLLVDPDPPTWRSWLAYRNTTTGTDYKAPQRNSGAYLKLLGSAGNEITHETVVGLASEARDRNRGSGGRIIWARAQRYVQVHLALSGHCEENPEAFLKIVFEHTRWTSNEHRDETARVDMEALLEKSQHLLLREPCDLRATERLQNVARQLRYQIATREPFTPEVTSDLQITTLWGAKGITADHVYLIGACNEAIPGLRRPEYPGTDEEFFEEQRRLFYVSITRSKRTLVISRASKVGRGEAKRLGLAISPRAGYQVNLLMSRFLRDISQQLPVSVQGERWTGCSN